MIDDEVPVDPEDLPLLTALMFLGAPGMAIESIPVPREARSVVREDEVEPSVRRGRGIAHKFCRLFGHNMHWLNSQSIIDGELGIDKRGCGRCGYEELRLGGL